MIQLSVAIIAYNEEKNIARCLDSIKSIADEIVVVDSYSTDKTVEICKSYGAKVLQHKFEGHIEQKNYVLELTSYPYVLSLDADEVLSDELRKAIQAVKSSWQHDGYEMNRLANYCGAWIHHCGWYPDRKIRLFDKRKGKWTGVNPHDLYMLNDQDACVGYLDGDILHYSYYSISDHIQQVDYFTEITAKELYEEGRKASFIRMIGSPAYRFIRDFILKGGWLDGYYGFVVCVISSYAVFLKYAKLRELWKH